MLEQYFEWSWLQNPEPQIETKYPNLDVYFIPSFSSDYSIPRYVKEFVTNSVRGTSMTLLMTECIFSISRFGRCTECYLGGAVFSMNYHVVPPPATIHLLYSIFHLILSPVLHHHVGIQHLKLPSITKVCWRFYKNCNNNDW